MNGIWTAEEFDSNFPRAPSVGSDQKDLEMVTPYVRGSPGWPTIRPVEPDWVASTS